MEYFGELFSIGLRNTDIKVRLQHTLKTLREYRRSDITTLDKYRYRFLRWVLLKALESNRDIKRKLEEIKDARK